MTQYTPTPKFIYWRMFLWGLVFHPHGSQARLFLAWPVHLSIETGWLFAGTYHRTLDICLKIRPFQSGLYIPRTVQTAYCNAFGHDPEFDLPF